jgi:predicted AAA+ superfamily ATPase
MYIQRQLEDKIKLYAKHFPAVAILGLLQAGKTTLAQQIIETNENKASTLTLKTLQTSQYRTICLNFLIM